MLIAVVMEDPVKEIQSECVVATVLSFQRVKVSKGKVRKLCFVPLSTTVCLRTLEILTQVTSSYWLLCETVTAADIIACNDE